ncbi:MAG: DUF2218 domain-containing protein [Sphingopyxis sp.]|nr:DUF2218 domain-containing protein [Sphingopyxis sp.]
MTPRSFGAIASIPTAHASKYLQQLCKHWQHNLVVEFSPGHGTVTFPRDARGTTWAGDALVTFDADADALAVRIDASSDGHVEAMKDVVARHLNRFAFREAPLTFDWLAT